MSGVPVALAFTAGTLAAFNPCGFALLPTYLSLFVAGGGSTPAGGRAAALRRALAATLAMTGGFVTVFGLFGLVVAPLATSVERYLPWLTVVIGIALVGLGGWLLAGKEVVVSTPKLRTRGDPVRSSASMVLYGISYAVASLSCTIGPFLALTTAALRAGSLVTAFGVFAAYAAGMGLVVGILTLAAALAQQSLITRMRQVMRYVSRAGGGLLVLGGLYVTYYGWYELRVLGGDVGDDAVVGAVTQVQSAVVRFLTGLGPWPLIGVLAVLLAAVVASSLLRRRSRAARRAQPDDEHVANSRSGRP
ncbi:integral membrane protein [Longimycelium tulufanense]|uniref:Integral membrane protein n=1 Tax=Longimycelium tulufanense TaxID=907463 RepID=A0A8J3CDC9_9PSEU|nr:cytochrome c biogenesis CcdA family protein [Longimycelium tulufanense]GGM62794.1 integral membrane protein [Longimycelium tulufanense]